MGNFDPFTSKFPGASVLCYEQLLFLFNVRIVSVISEQEY